LTQLTNKISRIMQKRMVNKIIIKIV
jgi:hypothetical protein